MSEFNNEIRLAYYAGIKVGVEAVTEALEKVAAVNGNQLPIEYVKLVANNTVAEVEERLQNMEHGDELISVLDQPIGTVKEK